MATIKLANGECPHFDSLDAPSIDRKRRRVFYWGSEYGDSTSGAEMLSARDRTPDICVEPFAFCF